MTLNGVMTADARYLSSS